MTSAPSERCTVAVLFAGLSDLPDLPAATLRDHLDAVYTRLRGAVESRGGIMSRRQDFSASVSAGAAALGNSAQSAAIFSSVVRTATRYDLSP